MKDEIIESIFGCLERIEEKLDKQPVQTEQGKSEDNRNLTEAIMPLVDSMNRTNRNLCVLRDALKIVSERQKESRKELLTTKIYDQSKEIEELELAGWKFRALKATLPANNTNVIWLERNVWAGNKDGIHHCQQFVINYEDSIRRRYEMEQEATMRDSIGRLMIQQAKDIRKKMK